MKKLHLINHRGDIRPGFATDEEILAIADGLVEYAGSLLATVSIADDGAIAAKPLTRAEIDAAAKAAIARKEMAKLDAADEVGKIVAALDASLGLQARVDALPEIPGVSWHSVLTLWPDSNPAIEGAFRGWATAHEFKVNEGWSHYNDGISILAWTAVNATGREVARAQWRSVKTDDSPAAKADKESHEARRIVREERAAAQSGVSP